MTVALRGHGMGSSIDFDGAPSQSSESLRMVVPEQGITDAFTFCIIRMPQDEDIKQGRCRCTDPLRSEGRRDHSHMLVGALLADQCTTGFSLKKPGWAVRASRQSKAWSAQFTSRHQRLARKPKAEIGRALNKFSRTTRSMVTDHQLQILPHAFNGSRFLWYVAG